MNLLKSIGNMFSFGGTKPSQFRNDQTQQARNVSGLADFYRNMQQQGLARQKQFQPRYDAMVDRRLGQLGNPMNDGDASRFIGQGYSAANTAFDGANARLQRNLAARGIDGGIYAGAMGNLEGTRARAMGQTQNELAMRKMALRDQYAREALGLLGGQYGQAQQMAGAGTQGLSGNYGQLYSMYGNMASQDEQRRAQNRSQMLNLLGTAASAAVGIPRLGGGGGDSGGEASMPYGGLIPNNPAYVPYGGGFSAPPVVPDYPRYTMPGRYGG